MTSDFMAGIVVGFACAMVPALIMLTLVAFHVCSNPVATIRFVKEGFDDDKGAKS